MSITPSISKSISSIPNIRSTNSINGPNTLFLQNIPNCQYINRIKAPRRVLVRGSNAEGPLRRPSAPIKEAIPSLRAPGPPTSPKVPPSPPPPPPESPQSSGTVDKAPSVSSSFVTIEYQRQKAKELQEYFRQKKDEELLSKGQIFGFTKKNEISNGRWAMFGFAVGLLTEYATGSSFVDQMKLIISNLGIADLE